MILSNTEIRNNLKQAAIIFRKYNLGDSPEFKQFFKGINRLDIEMAWENAYYKIQNSEILKDSNSKLDDTDIAEVNKKVDEIISKQPLYHYLNSSFDIKNAKLKDENIERRVRQILAEKCLSEIIFDTYKKQASLEKSAKGRFLLASNKHKFTILFLTVACLFFAPRVLDALSLPKNILNKLLHKEYPKIENNTITLSVLADYFHEESKYKFNGAECNDGWESHSHGRGTCSHHGGIDHYFKEGEYRKTYNECLELAKIEILMLEKEAKSISWRD
jgi:hypothetical protein